MSDVDLIVELSNDIANARGKFDKLNAYYEGEHRLESLGLALPPELAKLRTVINWPRLVVDSLEERLDVEGFRVGEDTALADRLWTWWQANRLDVESSLAHTEALVQGRAFIVVGVNEDDPEIPLITVESSATMTTRVDPRTRKVSSALRLYNFDDSGNAQSATLYLPDRTSFFEQRSGRWVETDRIRHRLGVVPVVPMVNRARVSNRQGRSEMADVIPLTDAACRTLTNLQGAQEFLAVPQRYVLGASPEDFVGPNGEPKTQWEVYIGRFIAITNERAQIGQVSAADLRNFTQTIDSYARMVAGITGLPPHYLGFSSENPASADAIRSSESRLVKRSERRGTAFGDAWEEAMRVGLLLVDGHLPEAARRLETIWRDPGTPTYAAKVDAVVKLYTARSNEGPLLPREAAWEELGYSAEKRNRYRRYSRSVDNEVAEFLESEEGRALALGSALSRES